MVRSLRRGWIGLEIELFGVKGLGGFVELRVKELEAEENLRSIVEGLKKCRWSTLSVFTVSPAG